MILWVTEDGVEETGSELMGGQSRLLQLHFYSTLLLDRE